MKFLVLVRGFGGIDIDQLDSHLGIIFAGINDRHIGTHASDPADVGFATILSQQEAMP